MVTIEDVIQRKKQARTQPGNDELRSLPDRRAFIYGRVSSQNQIIQSKESIKEIASRVDLARRDGYKTNLDLAQVG